MGFCELNDKVRYDVHLRVFLRVDDLYWVHLFIVAMVTWVLNYLVGIGAYFVCLVKTKLWATLAEEWLDSTHKM